MNQYTIFGIIIGIAITALFYNLKKSGMLADAWKFIKNPRKY